MGPPGVDQRPAPPHPTPSNALSAAERLSQCHRPDHACLSPDQTIARLLDAEQRRQFSFYRVLRAAGEQHRRGQARPDVTGSTPQ